MRIGDKYSLSLSDTVKDSCLGFLKKETLTIRIINKDITTEELKEYQNGNIRIGFFSFHGLLFLLLKVGNLNWVDMMCTNQDGFSDDPLKLHLLVINTPDCKIMSTRKFTLSHNFCEDLKIGLSYQQYVDKEEALEIISQVHQYSTDQLVPQIQVKDNPKEIFVGTATAAAPPMKKRRSLEGLIVNPTKKYPDLDDKYKPFYCYLDDSGHCLCTVATNLLNGSKDYDDYEIAIPIKYILSIPHEIKGGYLFAEIPYDSNVGAKISTKYCEY